MQKKLLLIFQILVSVGLLGWLFSRQDLRAQFLKVVLQAHPGWLLAGLFVAGIGNFIGIFRWGIFVKILDLPVSTRDVLRIGGDAVKVVWLAARGCKKSSALMSVAMDRMSGIAALIFCSLLFMVERLDWLRQSPAVAGLIRFIFIYLIAISVLFALSLVLALRGIAERIPQWGPGRKQMLEFATAYRQFIEHWRESLIASGLTIFIFISYFTTFFCAARAFGVKVPLLDFFAIMPTVDIISALPVSVGGFGVREHLFTLLLGDLCHVASAQAVLISLGGALLTMAWGLGGLLALPSFRQATKNVPDISVA
jgi:glycosyltransferase 2 family protein